MALPEPRSPSSPRSTPMASDAPSPLGQRVRSLRIPDKGQSRGHGSALVAWPLCLVFAATTAVFGYLAFFQPRSVLTTEAESGQSPAGGAADTAPDAPAMPAAGSVVLESKGYIVPTQQILVSPQISGRIMALFVEEGKKVSQGDVLAEIERIQYEADCRGAAANLKTAQQRLLELETGNRPEEILQAQKELEESQAQLEQLELQFQRVTQLYQARSISEREYETSRSDWEAAARRVERLEYKLDLLEKGERPERIEIARAEVELCKAELTKAQWRLDNCTIRAPISGTILKKNAEEGNIVNPVAFNGSFSLCDMADLSQLEVDLNIQERDVARVFRGQQCKIRAEAYPDRVYDGEVSRLMPIADRAKGAVPVRVKVLVPAEEEGVYLKPEMGATVSFFAGEPPATEPVGDPTPVANPSSDPATIGSESSGPATADDPSRADQSAAAQSRADPTTAAEEEPDGIRPSDGAPE